MADINELYVNNPALSNDKEEFSADKSSRNIKRDVSKALERRKTENSYNMTCIRRHRKSLSCQPVSGKEYDLEQSIGIDVKCPRSRNLKKKCKMVAYSHGNRSRNIKGLKMRCKTASSKDYKCVANFALGESEYNVDSGSREKSEFELNCEVNWAGFLGV
ncbi:hypothetical protein THOM_1139 [Trachipleistophora hominis]|uniref:Uncharacterized protein n=1 Tax=Trachipleistophora hominis TaxID=72359 RepID=L7JWT8_TRAHO|nr:hypothetical protein THOM_1139 [Trachipleistophora hominis]